MQIPSCTRWDTFRLRSMFYSKGFNLKKRDSKLNQLVENYDPQNLVLIQHLICANRGVIFRANRTIDKFHDDTITSNYFALHAAVRTNNIPVVKTFSHYFDFKKGFPFYDLGFPRYFTMDGELREAIETSEEMTKLLIEGGVNPLDLAKTEEGIYGSQRDCSDKPGCNYYKEAVKKAKEQKNDRITKENKELTNLIIKK